MGTHPNVPSKLSSTGETLAEHIKSNASELIGEAVISAFPDSKDGALPFLFKVLSIGTALSIQAHPDKALGKQLFEERPNIYKGASSPHIGGTRLLSWHACAVCLQAMDCADHYQTLTTSPRWPLP